MTQLYTTLLPAPLKATYSVCVVENTAMVLSGGMLPHACKCLCVAALKVDLITLLQQSKARWHSAVIPMTHLFTVIKSLWVVFSK